MSGVGLEVFLEDLIPEIAYSGEKGEFFWLRFSHQGFQHHGVGAMTQFAGGCLV